MKKTIMILGIALLQSSNTQAEVIKFDSLEQCTFEYDVLKFDCVKETPLQRAKSFAKGIGQDAAKSFHICCPKLIECDARLEEETEKLSECLAHMEGILSKIEPNRIDVENSSYEETY